jgi:HNH endonuclease
MSKSVRASNRGRVSPSVRDEVLREAGYKCANPTCRNILTLQLHHIVWVKEGGGNTALNLLALCGHCHDMHTHGHIPASAIRYWKGMLHALNHALSKESLDLLLFLHKRGTSLHWYSADGVLRFAALFAAGLIQFGQQVALNAIIRSAPTSSHQVVLSDKGVRLVEAWLAGDETKYKAALDA